MIITLEMRAAGRCKACSVLTPMPGIRNQLSCRNCAAALLLKEGQDCRDAGRCSGAAAQGSGPGRGQGDAQERST
jgi:hypothetical protein